MVGKLTVTVTLLLCISCVHSAPTGQTNQKSYETGPAAQILRYEYEPTDRGYRFEYETSDGQIRREEAFLKPLEDGRSILAVYGSYSYTGPDGVTYAVEYISDENGYQPVGKHLPGSSQIQHSIK